MYALRFLLPRSISYLKPIQLARKRFADLKVTNVGNVEQRQLLRLLESEATFRLQCLLEPMLLRIAEMNCETDHSLCYGLSRSLELQRNLNTFVPIVLLKTTN